MTGHIPEHLDGRYLRIGPNPIAEVDPATYHWFSGDGMVHGVRLRNGRAPSAATGLPYLWNDAYPARIGVMPRDGDNGDVRWFEIPPAWVFHPMNSYDTPDGRVVLDVIRHPKVFAANPSGFDDGAPRLERWTIHLATGRVDQEILDDRNQEFPRIDERRTARDYRFGYAPGSSAGPELLDTLIKHDLSAGTALTHQWGPGQRIGEFVFEPTTPEAAEDDGVLMGFVHDAASDTSRLVIHDAQTLEEMASVHLPCRVPDGFHGNWVPTV